MEWNSLYCTLKKNKKRRNRKLKKKKEKDLVVSKFAEEAPSS